MPTWLEQAAPSELGVFLGKSASPPQERSVHPPPVSCFPGVFADVRALALDAADRYAEAEIGEAEFEAALEAVTEARDRASATSMRMKDWTTGVGRMARTAAASAQIAHEVAVRGYHRSLLGELRSAVLEHAGGSGAPRKNPIAPVMRPLFLEHFGDVRQPISCDPSWRTETVVLLAQGMYDSRDFSAMPILADALQDAGCDNTEILDHCRGPGPHVRGCWVVDLILGKE